MKEINLAVIADGASKSNGQYAGIGVVIVNRETGERIEKNSKYIGKATNNEAEYKAIIEGIDRIIALCDDYLINSVQFLSDSQLIVDQIKGNFKIKQKHLKPLFAEAIDKFQVLKNIGVKFELNQVPRKYTWEADELASEATKQGADSEIESDYPFLTKQ